MINKDKIKDTIKTLTFGKIRFHDSSFSWVWTPWTYGFGHNGWVFFNIKWLRLFWRFKK